MQEHLKYHHIKEDFIGSYLLCLLGALTWEYAKKCEKEKRH
jgi:hypothetical protein